MVNPYPFRGGSLSDYEIFVGEAGTYNTRYIPTGDTIPCVQPSGDITPPSQLSGLDMLPIANLALSVLNLGVGVYNAFQLHKVQEKLDQNQQQIQAYFGNIQDVLNAHHRTLEVLACSQYNLSQQMGILRKEMHSGFQQIVQEIQDVEARRRKKEFYANTHELLEVYGRFIDHLPDLSEADRLIDRSERLEALIQAELSEVAEGRPERLPLVVALSFSVRAKSDAFEAKGGNYIISADKALEKLKQKICQEAYALCDGQELYTLSVEMPEVIYQYALLNRSIEKGRQLRLRSEPELVFAPEEVIWNDGCDELRSIFEKAQTGDDSEQLKGKSQIQLTTLADYDWYVRFADEQRLTFDVHSQKSIQLGEILRKVGHPEPDEGVVHKQDLEVLRLFALPESCDNFSRRMQQEFDWRERPQLTGYSS